MSFFVDVFSNISLMCFFCSGIEQINIIINITAILKCQLIIFEKKI